MLKVDNIIPLWRVVFVYRSATQIWVLVKKNSSEINCCTIWAFRQGFKTVQASRYFPIWAFFMGFPQSFKPCLLVKGLHILKKCFVPPLQSMQDLIYIVVYFFCTSYHHECNQDVFNNKTINEERKTKIMGEHSKKITGR